MKKIITASFIFLFFTLISAGTFAQQTNGKDYEIKKASFYKQYLLYKNNLANGIFGVKPVDPSGLFIIDENNNFVQNNILSVGGNNYNSPPWIGGQERDAVSGYTFSQTTTTYTPAYGGTLLCSGGCDDGYHSGIALPFSFSFNGTAYTTVTVTHNGWLQFGTTTPSGYSPICTGSYPNVVAAFARDLYGLAAGDSLRYITTGTTPNRVFIVEWSKWGIYSSGLNEIDFMIKLFETTNQIQIVYKPETPTTSITDVQVGLMGATNADFNTRTTTTNWSATTAGVACSNNTFNSSVYPASGLTFTWNPPPTGPMGYYSSNTNQILPGVPVAPGSVNNQIIQIVINDTGVTSPLFVSRLMLTTAGSNNPGTDISNAKLYYTRSSSTFSTALQYGTTIVGPSGVMNFTDTASLDPNAGNYFWLTYDISGGAVVADSVDATCDSVIVGGIAYAPTVSAPAGSRPIDPYCLGQYSIAGCPYGLYITNVLFGSINNTTGCNGNLPYCYDKYLNLSTTVRQNNPYPIAVTNQNISNPNATAFGIWVDWNNNNSFADGGEYYATTVIPPNTTTSGYATITVPAGATLGNHRMRIRTNLSTPPASGTYCSTLTYGEQEDYTVNVIADTNMTYNTSTTTQNNTSNIFTPSNNTQIIGIEVNVFGTISPMSATSFSLNTSGSTNPATDISKAKIWFTGSSSVFAATTLVGAAISPNGAFVVSGSQQLLPGTNYFWLTYDVPSSAVSNDTLDAVCNSVTIGGVPRIPSPTSPAGFRIIGGTTMCGNFTIPGNYPNFASAIADLNTRGTCGPVTFTVSAGFADTTANLVITASGTAANPITFKGTPTLAMVNPVIVAGVGTSTTTDGIIKFSGSDYITFDGIDLMENPANTNTTTQMEWGFALLKPDATNGCQNITIKNCNITLNKTNANTKGIYVNNHTPISTTTFVITGTGGANSYNSFLNNTVANSFMGIYVSGYADASPYTFYDQNNTISGCNVSNYGGTATTAYGIYGSYQNNYTVTDCIINSTGGTNSTGILAGIYGSVMTNSNIKITNNTISLTNAGTATTVYGIYNSGSTASNNTVLIQNNTIQNCDLSTATSSSFYNIYNGLPCFDLNISDNKIIGYNYGTSAATGTVIYSIYSASSIINSITITNNLDSGNTINGTTAYSTYRMYNGVSTLNSTITGNKIKNNIICGTTAASTTYGIYNSSGSFTCNMSNNTVSDNSLPTTSSQSMYFLYNTATAPAMDYTNNTVSGNTGTGSGTFYSMYYSASPGLNSTVNITNNTILNQSKTTATGTGSIYGIYQGSNPQGTLNINNNTVTGFTSAAATLFAGIYQASTPANYININNNKVGNFTNAGISTIYGIYSTATTSSQLTLTGDSVFNITSAGSTIYGMFLTSSGLNWNVYKNSISGLTTNTSTTAVSYGIYDGVSLAGATLNIFNNFISDINATASTSIAPAISGIHIASGAATTTINAFYNTIYLNAVSSSVTTFGTAGIYALTTPIVNLKNNIIVNNSTPGPTGGQTVAYRRSSTTLTTYGSSSNNNCFWAGTPAANRLIYYDGTNSDQTLGAYKTRVVPRDNNSIRELPPFINGSTPPYDLRINTAAATQLESGGQVISSPFGIIDDKFGTARYPNSGYPVGGFTPVAPDIGANEFGGLNADTASPFISYTPLGTGGTSNRPFTNVLITDANGVDTNSGTKPRCYYKRSTDANTINDNTNVTDGWKYVESNGLTSPFDFTIDYSKLNGGTGVVAGNVINYFVIAQDIATTPNVGSNQATFATAPVSVALVTANTPIANNLSYNIGTNVFSGNYNVGSAQTYTSLTGAGGLFASINAGTVSGNITATITSDLVEDGTNALNIFNETGPGGYRLRIVPADATPKTISGSVAQGMIRFNGSRRVTIDGGSFFAGQNYKVNLSGELLAPGKYLTFRNTNGSNPTFTFINDAVGDSIKYCNIESNNISTSTAAAGTILFSTTTGIQGNDSNVIAFCDIRDRSDAAGTPAFGIYNNGSTTTPMQYNSYNVVSNCNVYNYFYDGGVFTGGIYLNSGTTDWTITNNSFYQTSARTVSLGSTFASIYNNISTLTNNNQITNNFIGGSAPQCGGTPMTYTGTGAYALYGIQAFVSTQAPTIITGNTIRNIDLTFNGATLNTNFFRAIYAQTGWINVNNNNIGIDTGTGNITITTNVVATTVSVGLIHHLGLGTINGNKIGSITYAGNSTALNTLYAGIYWSNSSPSGLTFTVDNNLIGSLTTPNSINMTNNSDLHQFRAIYFTNSTGSTNNITNNTIANITSSSTSAVNGCFIYGINNNGGAGNYNFSNNTVRNLTINNDALTAGFLLLGINSTGSGLNNFNQNTIKSLYSNGTGAGANLVGGILAGGTIGGSVTKNKIFDLRYSGSGTIAPAPVLLGINVQSTGAYTIVNNMVSLTNGDASMNNLIIGNNEHIKTPVPETLPFSSPLNPKDYDGVSTDPKFNLAPKQIPCDGLTEGNYNHSYQPNNIRQNKEKGNIRGGDESAISCSLAGVYHTSTSPGACNYFYNTFYIGGSQPGSLNSWVFYRSTTSTGMLNLKNNLFVNARTGGSGSYYAVANETTNPYAGWTSATSNYNTFICSNSATIGEWGLGVNQSMNQWTASSNGDKQSYGTTTAIVSPASLLTNISSCDLTILSGNSAAWSVSGKGIALSNVNTDFTGDTRVTSVSGGCTDIGADEFAATPPSNPVAVQVNSPLAGGTTEYYIYGRKICSVEWGTGGTSYPTSLNINYYSGINPASLITNPNRTSNSYLTVTPVGTLTGATYDITLYFGDNETYSITSPNTNTTFAKLDNVWASYPRGTTPLMCDVDWNNLTGTIRGLYYFSTFALVDHSIPCMNLVYPAYGSNPGTSVTLTWNRAALSTSYRVQLSLDSLFGTTIVNDSLFSGDTTRPVTGLTTNTRYFWRVRGTNGTGTGAWSHVYKFTAGPPPPAIVNLKVIPGGFYNTGTGKLNMRDTIKAILIDSTGCLRSDSSKAVLDSVTFSANISFSNAATGSYYLYVFHRNHIFISSRLEQGIIRGSTVNYDFTNDSTKAYGNILVRVSSAPLLYGMIPGDANRDGFVDGLDQTIWIAQNGLDGYLSADFNGDSFVDGLDQTLWVLFNGQSYFVPCELTFENPVDHAKKINGIYNNQIEQITKPRQNNR